MSSVEKVSAVFISSGEENVPLIDMFNDNDLQIKNSLVSKLSNLSNDAISTITSNAELLTRVAGVLITKDLGSFDLSSTGMFNIIDNTDFGKNLKGMTSSITDKFKNGMNTAFKAIHLNPETALGTISMVANEVSYLPFTNSGDVNLTTLFLNKLSNNNGGLSKVVNMDWEYSVLSGTISSMMDYGGGDIIDSMIDNYRSDYDNNGMIDIADLIIGKAVKKTIQDVVYSGKLKNIKKHLQRIGVGEAVEQYPNIARDIVKYYRLPKKMKVKEYIDELTLMEQTLDLADPKWYNDIQVFSNYEVVEVPTPSPHEEVQIVTTTRNRYNLFTFLESSIDSKTIMGIHPDRKYEMQISIARDFPDRSSESMAILKGAFPALVLSDEMLNV